MGAKRVLASAASSTIPKPTLLPESMGKFKPINYHRTLDSDEGLALAIFWRENDGVKYLFVEP